MLFLGPLSDRLEAANSHRRFRLNLQGNDERIISASINWAGNDEHIISAVMNDELAYSIEGHVDCEANILKGYFLTVSIYFWYQHISSTQRHELSGLYELESSRLW